MWEEYIFYVRQYICIYFRRSKLAVTHHYYSFYMHTFFIVIIVVVNPTPVVIVVINVRWRFRLSFFDTRIDNHSVAVRRSLPCKLFRRFKLNYQRRNFESRLHSPAEGGDTAIDIGLPQLIQYFLFPSRLLYANRTHHVCDWQILHHLPNR